VPAAAAGGGAPAGGEAPGAEGNTVVAAEAPRGSGLRSVWAGCPSTPPSAAAAAPCV
jgi:hypothetical protein